MLRISQATGKIPRAVTCRIWSCPPEFADSGAGRTCCIAPKYRRKPPHRGRTDKTHCEHNESGYPSIADMRADIDWRRLVPIPAVSRCSKMRALEPELLDHLVGGRQKRRRHGK